MDCNSYSYAPYMLDSEPKEMQKIEKCAWCNQLEHCTGELENCHYQKKDKFWGGLIISENHLGA